jgi:hypothetical protein
MAGRKSKSLTAYQPCVFISHISQEKDLALAVKQLVETYFVQAKVFVSSVPEDLPPGDNWLDAVIENLDKCSAVLVLCSKKSVERPWINFEAGAGWIRRVPVIPICHSGMEPDQLPMPLRLLQAIRAGEVQELKAFVSRLADILGSRIPQFSFEDFILSLKSFEAGYAGGADVLQIYESSREVQLDFGNRLKKADHEVWICGVHFSVSLSDWRSDYLGALARGVAISVAVLDPECDAVQTTASSYAMEARELQRECQDTIDKLLNLRKERDSLTTGAGGKVGQLNAVKFRQLPRARYYVFDPNRSTGVVLFTPYVEGLRSSHSPTYSLRAGSAIAEPYLRACRALLEGGVPI